MFPNAKYHERVPDGERWAIRHLPFYGRWFRFITFYPGSGMDIERSRVDPNFDDSDGMAISESNQATREVSAWIPDAGWRRPRASRASVMPDYPATAKRTLQDNGSWLACLENPTSSSSAPPLSASSRTVW